MSLELAVKIFKFLPNVILNNQYGPTESCQVSFEYKLDATNRVADHKIVPVGKIVDNKKGYILDKHHQLLPKGVIGDAIYRWSWLSARVLESNEANSREVYI